MLFRSGTGTLGSAVGQLIIGYTVGSNSERNWQYGYLLVIAIDISVTLLPILRIVYSEFLELKKIRATKNAVNMSSVSSSSQTTTPSHLGGPNYSPTQVRFK